ncbi:DUF4355 domain-containing protein [Actinocorallia sp. API 0066]|uniref:capsid assembly scaffolding protein Gp46 family protein n=1 Tax=Actinocorallia sp. API 0066 TaxID=2896846 RepID=UPI001E3B8072|nr:DUF4355 domain-containing protein [Actinocorallia sp. API 0066]MCD0450774.1 DUF4355 domain-containing protein [Actinocorallia sp. API 0066]
MSDDDKPTPPAGGDKTFTQADLDRLIAERLKREREKYADYDELKQRAQAADQAADSSKTELQKLTARVEAAEKKAAASELKALKSEIAQAKGLTPSQARRLQGSTREELEADADDLLEAFGGSKKDEPKDTDKETEGDGKKDEPDERTEASPFGRPKERLVPGAAPEAKPEEPNDDLADAVLKRTRGL